MIDFARKNSYLHYRCLVGSQIRLCRYGVLSFTTMGYLENSTLELDPEAATGGVLQKRRS